MRFFNFILISLLLLFGVALEGYGQVDIRECDFNCAQSSYSVTSVYLSDINGNPISSITESCTPGDPVNVYISFNYISNRGNSVFNTRIFADLNIAGNIIPINYFYGELPPARQGDKITLEDFPFVWTCGDPIFLENALVVWTPNNKDDLSGSDYECDDYPPVAQCSFQSILPVGGVPLSASIDYFPGCTINGLNPVQLSSTINGGTPPYSIIWTLDSNPTVISDEPFPILNFSPGEYDLNFVVTSGVTSFPVSIPIIIPEELPENIITGLEINDNFNEAPLEPNGSISLDLVEPERYSYLWTYNGNFFSTERNIDNLSAGTYEVLITDEFNSCRLFSYTLEDDFTILPAIYSKMNLFYVSLQNLVEFIWSTTKEWESSHFEIERAVEGLKFEKIGEIKSAGWSDKIIEYEFEDTNLPLTGGNLLYRLKQVDLNGNFHFSEVLSVRIPGVEFTSGVWRAYPNPTFGNELRVNLVDASLYNNEALTFRLIHPMVQTLPMSVASESEMNEVLSDLSRRMPKGVFVVEIQWGQKVEHIKVLKQ
jgi:hypothetical protein